MTQAALSSTLRNLRSSASVVLFGTHLRKGLSASAAVHLSIAGAVALSSLNWTWEVEPDPIKEPDLIAFNVGPDTDSEERADVPEIMPPAAAEDAVGPPTDAPVQEVAFVEGGAGDVGMVWTPPVPESDERPGGVVDGSPESTMEVVEIKLPGTGTEPVLISYDTGRFSDQQALQEAYRLSGRGRLEMEMTIGEDGKPIGCSIRASSGSNVLDDLGCALAMSYVYEPARDSSGREFVAQVTEVLEWLSDAEREAADSPSGLRRAVTKEDLGVASADSVFKGKTVDR